MISIGLKQALHEFTMHINKRPSRRSAKWKPTPVTYFMAGADLVKIGYTNDIRARFSCIRMSSPVPIYCIATIPGTAKESDLHYLFRTSRQHGEWFTLDESIIRWLLAANTSMRAARSIKEIGAMIKMDAGHLKPNGVTGTLGEAWY